MYWYKFLQIAIQENRKINRQFYGRWGNLNLKFDEWWKKNWKHLFAKWDGEDPLIKTSTDKVKADAYKHRLKVYELRKQGLSHKEIVEKINKLHERVLPNQWEFKMRNTHKVSSGSKKTFG